MANIGFLYIPIAAFIIVSFANAFNIADGLDGLASGLLLICLGSFLAISSTALDQGLGMFISILMGSVGAFLYFNIYKARIWLGDVGSMALGASLGIIGLLTGKIIAVAFIGGVFVLEAGSSLLQILSKKFFGKKYFLYLRFIFIYNDMDGRSQKLSCVLGYLDFSLLLLVYTSLSSVNKRLYLFKIV